MEHINTYEQTHKKSKGLTTVFISGALVGALLVGGVKVGSLLQKKNAPAPINPKPETTTVSPVASELVLTEDFDINDPAAVTKRAQDIYNLSEKKCGVSDIQNSIYVINEKYDNIIYPDAAKSDAEKFEYLQQLALVFGVTLDDYLADYVVTMDQMRDKSVGNPVFAGTTKPVPCAYMWMPQDNEAKRFAIEIAKVYYEQRTNIRNNNLAAMTITANDYYTLYTKAKELELKTGDKILVFKQFSVVNPIFTPLLSKEQTRDLDDALGIITTPTNKLFSSAAENLKLPEKLKDGLENGSFAKTITKLEEKYVIGDRQDAESRVEAVVSGETVIVDEGGKPASGSSGSQEVINDGKVTTTVSESEFVAPIPNEGTSEDVISGGEVVEEHTTEPVTEPSTTKPSETTTYVDDENIPVMGEEDFFGEAAPDDINNYRKSLVK